MSQTTGMPANPQGKRPRDPRLDFFRGMAMFIILLAHTPGNSWTLWIPARFGFSDATEIFVFCSGMASAIAFGTLFAKKSFLLGTARIAFRVWQVYWAHIGIFLVTAMMLYGIDHFDLGAKDRPYIHSPYVVPLFEHTGEALIGFLTLTYVPGLFDILPMYLVILVMVPVVMALHRLAGFPAVVAFVLAVWGAVNLAGYARNADEVSDPTALQAWLISLGERLTWMNLPGYPWGDNTWFFNPFGWQLVFFTGFSFGMGWLPAPPVRRWLIWAAAIYVVVVIPFAWFKIFRGLYLPEDLTVLGWAVQPWIAEMRDWIEPVRWKTWIGATRYLHFLALAYLAWVAVGPGGVRLSEGIRPLGRAPLWLLIAAGLVAVATAPYTYIEEIAALAPALDAWLIATIPLVPGERIGLLHLAHLGAVILLVWSALGPGGRRWLAVDAFTRAVPVIRKVGTQSLAVFVVSIPLARFDGWMMDLLAQEHVWGDRDVWVRAVVNLGGFAVLIGVAYLVSWFKKEPWRDKPKAVGAPTQATGAAPAEPERGGGAVVPETPSKVAAIRA